MNLKARIARLERDLKGVTLQLVMKDGRKVPVDGADLLDCLLAAMLGEDHPLMETVRRATREEGDSKLVGLIHSFAGPEHRGFMAGVRKEGAPCAAEP